MSALTREAARKELGEWVRVYEGMGDSGKDARANAILAAIYRHALAALDDAERMDTLESMANQPGGILLHDGSEKGRGTGLGLRPGTLVRTLREAVDGRRGVTPTTLHRSKDA